MTSYEKAETLVYKALPTNDLGIPLFPPFFHYCSCVHTKTREYYARACLRVWPIVSDVTRLTALRSLWLCICRKKPKYRE